MATWTRYASSRLGTVVLYTLSVAVVLAVWQLSATRIGLLGLFPAPSSTVRRSWELLSDGTLLAAAAASLGRILAGFVFGSALGTAIGLMMGAFRSFRAAVEPYVNFLRFIPTLAWFGPVLLWFGGSELTPFVLITYGTVFVVAINAAIGVVAVPANKTRMASAFGASSGQRFAYVIFPATVPYILAGMRMAMGNAFMTVVAAEMLASSTGLGYLLISSQFFFDVPGIFSAIIVLGALGFTMDRIFVLLIRRWGGRFTVGTDWA